MATFKSTLERLLLDSIITPGTVVSLYNWGEPLLHPEFEQLVSSINSLGLRYAISTNASRPPRITSELVRNLDHVIFSMPGYSQESYDRIHGFRFDEIQRNIVKMVQECRGHGFQGRFSISFHVYRFNTGEIKPCERFADRHSILFNPYFAILNHWWEIEAYVRNQLPEPRRKAAEADLFTLENMQEKLASAPRTGYRCPQFQFLNIDENGNVATCCQIARDHPHYKCGSAVTEDISHILDRRERQPVCAGCISSGLANYLNTVLQRPPFYRRSLRQQWLRLTALGCRTFRRAAHHLMNRR